MAGRFSALFDVLRPRALARAVKAVDDLTQASRDLKRSVKQLDQHHGKMDARTSAIEDEVRALRGAVGDLQRREARLRAIYLSDLALQPALDAIGPVLDVSAIRTHVHQAFARAELHQEPFPFAVVDEVFPQAFYDAVIRAIPPVELFEGTDNKQRLVVPFEMAPAFSRRVWGFLLNEVVDGIIGPSMLDMFRAPLNQWLEATWPGLGPQPLDSRVRLQSTDGRILLRRRGYVISPHRDPKWGFVTCLLYLARPGDSPDWGTQLYRVDDDLEAEGVAPLWIRPERCTLVQDVPFTPNTALVFMNGLGAHGAHVPADAEPADLERYVYQFRLGPSGTSMRRLLEMLPEGRRGMWSGKAVDYV